MPNEITVQVGLRVQNGNLRFQSTPNGFAANQASARGPAPGSVHVTTAGVSPDFSQLVRPGWVFLFNSGLADADWGLYRAGEFLPVGVVRAGTGAVFEFSTALTDYYSGTGTGTFPDTWVFHLKTVNGSTDVFVGCLDA